MSGNSLVEASNLPLAQRGFPYFAFAVQQSFKAGASKFLSFDEAVSLFLKRYLHPDDQKKKRVTDRYVPYFVEILLLAEEQGACEIVRDDFAPPHVKFDKKALTALFQEPEFEPIRTKHERLGSAGDSWLGTALFSIASNLSKEEIDEFFSRNKSGNSTLTASEDLAPQSPDSDSWEPLQIDRQSQEFMQALESSERALHEIEASNGYAISEPHERNAIVHSIRGVLQALKDGTPSLNSVLHGLLSPLRFIAQKFGTSLMGEAAREAAQHIVRWLFGG